LNHIVDGPIKFRKKHKVLKSWKMKEEEEELEAEGECDV